MQNKKKKDVFYFFNTNRPTNKIYKQNMNVKLNYSKKKMFKYNKRPFFFNLDKKKRSFKKFKNLKRPLNIVVEKGSYKIKTTINDKLAKTDLHPDVITKIFNKKKEKTLNKDSILRFNKSYRDVLLNMGYQTLPFLVKRRDFMHVNFTVSGFYRDKITGKYMFRLTYGHRNGVVCNANMFLRKQPKNDLFIKKKH